MKIHNEPWTLVLSGKVAKNLVMGGKTNTSLQQENLRSDFRPENEPNRTSDWTEIPILTGVAVL